MNKDLKDILLRVRGLFMKYGIKSITMDDISRELGISKKTLYTYVSDKDELVGKIVDYETDLRGIEICECIKEGFNAIEELVEISVFMNKLMKELNPVTEHDLKKFYPGHYQKMVQKRREGIKSYILMNLKKGKSEGLYREEMNEEIISRLYLSRIEGIHLNDLFSVNEYTSGRIHRELLTYHVRGIATDKGIKVFEKKIKELEDKQI